MNEAINLLSHIARIMRGLRPQLALCSSRCNYVLLILFVHNESRTKSYGRAACKSHRGIATQSYVILLAIIDSRNDPVRFIIKNHPIYPVVYLRLFRIYLRLQREKFINAFHN